MNTRYCKGCDTEKPWSEFTIRRDTGRPCTLCKSCRSAKNNAGHVSNVPGHSEHIPEHYAEILAEIRALRAEVAELRQIVEAQQHNPPQHPTADVNINIRTPAPEDDPRYQNVKSKLLGLDFDALANPKKGH